MKFPQWCWSTLGKCERPGFSLGASYFIADHCIFAIFIAVALHESPGSLRDLWFCLYLKFRLAKCEAWDEFETSWRFRDFETSWRFPWSFIYTYSHSKEKITIWNVNDITWLNSGLLHFLSVTLKISTRVIYCRGQAVSESLFLFSFKFYFGVVCREVRRASLWTSP